MLNLKNSPHSVVALLGLLLFLLCGISRLTAQEAMIEPDVWLPESCYDPCAESNPLSYLPSEGERLCEQYPNYEASLGCTIANGTTTNYGAITLVEDKNFLVNGNWTIIVGTLQDFETSLVFRNCNFKIASGAQITVKCNNNKTLTYDGCNFFSCDEMWRGIAVNHHYTVLGIETPSFNFTKCQIEDAASALWFENPSLAVVFQIKENTFNNNYIGVTAFNESTLGAPQWMSLVFLGNGVGATHNLRPFYSIKIPPGWPRAKAGVSIKRLSTFIGSATSTNNFFFMDYGIVCENSVMTSRKNIFNALWGDGIMAKSSSLTVVGGNEFIGTTTFPGITPPVMHSGINAFGSDLFISGNTFEDRIWSAIYSRDNFNAEQIEINDNYFEPATEDSRFGILMDRSAASSGGLIPAHNQIFQNHFNSNLEDNLWVYTCIFIQGPNTATDNINIFENKDINLTFGTNYSYNSGEGIYVFSDNADNFRILDNEIHLNGAFSSLGGFYGVRFSAIHSANCHIELNNVSGVQIISGAVPYNVYAGILVHGGLSEVSLCENVVANGKNGIRFLGNNDYPVIAENKIYDHEIGLWIRDNVELGYHDGRGNQWLGKYSIWAAQKEGMLSPSPTDPITVRFWVSESDMLPFLPPFNLLSPNPDDEPDPMKKWFRFDPTTLIDYCTPEATLAGLSPSESKVANGTSLLVGTSLWDARRHLYRKLLEHPEFAPAGSTSAVFKETFQNTSVAYFAQFDAYCRSATRFPASEQSAYDNLLQGIKHNQEQCENMLELVNYDLSLASPELFEQVRSLNEQTALEFGSLLGAKESRLLQVAESLNAALSFNNGLATANAHEQARKTLNAIQVSRSMGNPMSENQYQSLLLIAAQSEEEVGIAKSEAISQLGPCDLGEFLTDNQEQEGEVRSSYPSIISSNDQFSVYPNPGADWFVISVPKGINGLLRVTDLTGRTVHTQHITKTQFDYNVNLANSPIGLYGFSFFDSSGKLLKALNVSVQR